MDGIGELERGFLRQTSTWESVTQLMTVVTID